MHTTATPGRTGALQYGFSKFHKTLWPHKVWLDTPPQNAILIDRGLYAGRWDSSCSSLSGVVTVKNGISTALAGGEASANTFYAQTTALRAEVWGCPRLVLQGNHTVFENMPEAFMTASLEFVWGTEGEEIEG